MTDKRRVSKGEVEMVGEVVMFAGVSARDSMT
jgi:hypothetical protein